MSMANKNTQHLDGIRCPKCHETRKFAIQATMNIVLEDDGMSMASEPPADFFPGRVLDEDEGLKDEDPIACMNNYCGERGTVAEFRLGW